MEVLDTKLVFAGSKYEDNCAVLKITFEKSHNVKMFKLFYFKIANNVQH